MLIDVAVLMLAFLLSIPAITGYFAHSYGKSFWGWFAIGCLLPVIAQVLLAFLCYKEAKRSNDESQYLLVATKTNGWVRRSARFCIRHRKEKTFPNLPGKCVYCPHSTLFTLSYLTVCCFVHDFSSVFPYCIFPLAIVLMIFLHRQPTNCLSKR